MADDKKIIFSMVGVSKAFQPNKQVLKNIYLSFFYGAKIGIIGGVDRTRDRDKISLSSGGA
jgi:ABC-type polysaccharide/polyol phosphate transport system ATPase subunit